MKRIVFFICLCFLTPTSINASTINDCNNGEIEVEKVDFELVVNKRGENPFLITIPRTNQSHYIFDTLCTEHGYILYGYVHVHRADTYYDSLIIELDKDGNIINTLVTDYGELEEIKNMYFYDNTYFVVTTQNEFSDDMDFMKTFITLYDLGFTEIGRYEFDEEVKEIEMNNGLLVVNFQWDHEYDIGVLSNTEIVYNNDYLGVEERYNGMCYIPFVNDAKVNGVSYENGFFTDYPGHYELKYNDQTYTFTVDPIVSGVEDLASYNEEVQIEVSKGYVLLNDEVYVNSEVIKDPGYYYLTIKGENEYQKEFSFTINSTIKGLINGHTYSDDLSVSFSGIGYLNGNQVTSPIIVDKEGDYVFRVVGLNGYSEEYFFNLTYQDAFDIVEFVQKADIYVLIVVVIGGVIIIKKSK